MKGRTTKVVAIIGIITALVLGYIIATVVHLEDRDRIDELEEDRDRLEETIDLMEDENEKLKERIGELEKESDDEDPADGNSTLDNETVVPPIIVSEKNFTVPAGVHRETIFADRHIKVGHVYVWNVDLQVINIAIILDQGWSMTASHVDISKDVDGIPASPEGDPIPEQFDHGREYEHNVTRELYAMNINDMGLEYFDEIVIISECSVIYFDASQYGNRTGWAGSNDITGTFWAAYFEYVFEFDGSKRLVYASFGWEDLPFNGHNGISNDWDYNDLLIDVNITALFDREDRMVMVQFEFIADDKRSDFDHELVFDILPYELGSSGHYTISRWDADGIVYSSAPERYENRSWMDWTIFTNTTNAPKERRVTILKIDFDQPFEFDMNSIEYDEEHPHGNNLFFNMNLIVLNTEEKIKNGDIRMIYVPINWNDPDEGEAVWKVYPYGESGRGVEKGPDGEPIFHGRWYTV